jgi:hypothetical protein
MRSGSSRLGSAFPTRKLVFPIKGISESGILGERISRKQHGQDMDQIRSGCVEMQWDPGNRLCTVRYHDGPKATAENGRILVEAMTAWVDPEHPDRPEAKPFAILVDGEKIQGGQPGYRAVMGAFYKARKDRVLFALFHLGPVLRIASEMFALGSGLKLKAFATEELARAWLRKEGAQA